MEDKGHKNLIDDLEQLLELAKNKEFHDFENKNYDFPKRELAKKLEEIRTFCIEGKYDN